MRYFAREEWGLKNIGASYVGPGDARSSYLQEAGTARGTRGDGTMRVMVIVKATTDSEAGMMPTSGHV